MFLNTQNKKNLNILKLFHRFPNIIKLYSQNHLRGITLKKLSFILFFILTLTFIPKQEASALSVSARYACVIDAMSGNILFEKNAHEKHSMASTTKIMTALVALENKPLTDIVTASKKAVYTEGSSIYLKQGEKITLEDLLYGLMLSSGNDAAVAIAEHVGGDTETFAQMMTKKAQDLGLKNTSFKNPNGLDAEGHYTTAYDLAIITKAALENEKFKEIVSTKTKNISNGNESYMRTLTNHNKLLNMYEGCIGVKTGYTKKTGRCLVSAAERNGFCVIAVTLSAPDDWNDHKRMLDFAFNSYSKKPLILKDMVLKSIPIENGSSKMLELTATDSYYVTLTKEDDLNNIKLNFKTPQKLTAPIKKGTILGSIEIFYKEKFLTKIDLSAGIDVVYVEPPKPTFYDNLKKMFSLFLMPDQLL